MAEDPVSAAVKEIETLSAGLRGAEKRRFVLGCLSELLQAEDERKKKEYAIAASGAPAASAGEEEAVAAVKPAHSLSSRFALQKLADEALAPPLLAILKRAEVGQNKSLVLVKMGLATLDNAAIAVYLHGLKQQGVLDVPAISDDDKADEKDDAMDDLTLLLGRELQLRGALLSRGVNVSAAWARDLLSKVKTITELQHMQWSAINDLLGSDLLLDDGNDSQEGDAEVDEGKESEGEEAEGEEEEGDFDEDEGSDEEDEEDDEEGEDDTAVVAGPSDRELIKELFAEPSAPGVPAIRSELLANGLSMELSEVLEGLKVFKAADISEHVRTIVTKETTITTNNNNTTTTNSSRLLGAKLQAMQNNGSRPGGAAPPRAGGISSALGGLISSPAASGAFSRALGKYLPKSQANIAADTMASHVQQAQAYADKTQAALDKLNTKDLVNKSEDELAQRLDEVRQAAQPPADWKANLQGSARLLAEAEAQSALSFPTGNGVLKSYENNEDLVAGASGGIALYGVSFFGDLDDGTIAQRPYAPLLQKPTFVEMTGPDTGLESRVFKTTEESAASSFISTVSSAGVSVAESSVTSFGLSKGGSASFTKPGPPGGPAAAGTGTKGGGNTRQKEKVKAEQEKETKELARQGLAKTAIILEYVKCPMRTFRIPRDQMKLTEEAKKYAKEVDTTLKAKAFLDMFGSHVSMGRHLLGGVFFRTTTMSSKKAVSTEQLFAEAGEHNSNTKGKSKAVGLGLGGSLSIKGLGISGGFGANFSKSTETSKVKFKTNATGENTDEREETAFFETTVKSLGPNAASVDGFGEELLQNTRSWSCIDRGPLEALVPVWDLLEVMSDVDEEYKNAAQLIRRAWEQRARVWQPLLLGDPDTSASLRTLVRSALFVEQSFDTIVRELCFVVAKPAESGDWEGDDGDAKKEAFVASVVKAAVKSCEDMSELEPLSVTNWNDLFFDGFRDAATDFDLIDGLDVAKDESVLQVKKLSEDLSYGNWTDLAERFKRDAPPYLLDLFLGDAATRANHPELQHDGDSSLFSLESVGSEKVLDSAFRTRHDRSLWLASRDDKIVEKAILKFKDRGRSHYYTLDRKREQVLWPLKKEIGAKYRALRDQGRRLGSTGKMPELKGSLDFDKFEKTTRKKNRNKGKRYFNNKGAGVVRQMETFIPQLKAMEKWAFQNEEVVYDTFAVASAKDEQVEAQWQLQNPGTTVGGVKHGDEVFLKNKLRPKGKAMTAQAPHRQRIKSKCAPKDNLYLTNYKIPDGKIMVKPYANRTKWTIRIVKRAIGGTPTPHQTRVRYGDVITLTCETGSLSVSDKKDTKDRGSGKTMMATVKGVPVNKQSVIQWTVMPIS